MKNGEKSLGLKRTGNILRPQSKRVLVRPFLVTDGQRVRSLMERLATLSNEEVKEALDEALHDFASRHADMPTILRRHYERARVHLDGWPDISEERQMLAGAYFTSEYALESAALFNPSIVPAPNQDGVAEGDLRFVISLRATGEGHISSIEFREGVVDAKGKITMEEAGSMVTEPERVDAAAYERELFARKLAEIGLESDYSWSVLNALEERFTIAELRRALDTVDSRGGGVDIDRVKTGMEMLAESNYETQFSSGQRVEERIIFPSSPSERNGIEDARFVAFRRDDGSVIYYATYTAYDGRVILPQLIETEDFLYFKIRTLNGPAAQNKGMALFPRLIGGRYAMISRQDNENVFLMFSDHPHFWNDYEPLFQPKQAWELVQMGNCGSPIETEEGWLVLTHGVGPMRKYCIGAILLDLE
ncbi:MAG: glycosidase, partial [Chthoniobacterales bacterium]